jgi:hypothetical protein
MNKIVEYQAKRHEIATLKEIILKRLEDEEKYLLDMIEEECGREKLYI